MTQLELQIRKLYDISNAIAFGSLFVGIFAISFAPIFIKFSEYELSPNATIFSRLWIGAAMFGVWNGLKAVSQQNSQDKHHIERKHYTSKDIWLLLGFGTFFAASLIFWAWSLTQTTIAISTVLHNLTPLFTCFLAWFLFRQRFDNKLIRGIFIAVTGVTILGLQDLQFATGRFQGDVAAVCSAIFYAMYLLVVEKLQTKFPTTVIAMWGCAVAALVTLPFIVLGNDSIFPYSVNGWIIVISQALVCQVIGQGLIAHSLNKLSSGFVAVAILLDSFLSAFLAWAIFAERLSFSDWLTFAVVLVGIYLAASSQSAVKATDEDGGLVRSDR